ncbi:hypothetical protein I79_021385 [Cricetulus griseus]|uniref:Uncharacterized protein n=1 Tax=Cricetulus griseus TaxID=10029 RepID=G3ICI7_CRIGR|nr:hypothetical protein I79_021385 [Cricetulus griseus]
MAAKEILSPEDIFVMLGSSYHTREVLQPARERRLLNHNRNRSCNTYCYCLSIPDIKPKCIT